MQSRDRQELESNRRPLLISAGRNDNISIYKPFTHQHLAEIGQSLRQLQNSFNSMVNFIPVRGNFSRGIFATTYLDCKIGLDEIKRIYEEYYA
mgnify:CR=1 FL=1